MAHQKVLFTDLKKNGYNLDSFTPDSYCCIGCCHFYFWTSGGEEVSPRLGGQGPHALRMFVKPPHWTQDTHLLRFRCWLLLRLRLFPDPSHGGLTSSLPRGQPLTSLPSSLAPCFLSDSPLPLPPASLLRTPRFLGRHFLRLTVRRRCLGFCPARARKTASSFLRTAQLRAAHARVGGCE